MSKTNNALSPNSGFTLIELLISMALGSILMALMAGSFWTQMRTSREQQMVVAMQQNLRAAIFIMERDILMAGYDNDRNNAPAATITAANSIQLTFEMVDDDTNTVQTIAYSLFDSDGDGMDDIGRSIDGVLPPAAIAENIEGIEFFYTLANGTQTTMPTNAQLGNIRRVGISILARTAAGTSHLDNRPYFALSGQKYDPFNDHFVRQLLTANVNCRNM